MSGAHVLSPGVGLTITTSGSPMPRNGFAFLTNVLGIDGADELELIPGHILRKATKDEIVIIKEILAENNGRVGGKYFYPWEMEDRGGGLFDDAPEQDWKYFVIAFNGTNQGINLLEQTLVLFDSGPRIGFTIIAWGGQRAVGLHPGRLFQAMQERSFSINANLIQEFTHTVNVEQAVQIRRLAEQLSAHPILGIDVPRMTQQLLNLQALDINSDVAFLGYFSLLESMLVHKPDPKDPNDSITRQVKKKITLLDNRWTPRLDYTAFGTANTESIWGRMYALRSAIAHGDVPDFRNSLQMLKDRGKAGGLLMSTVRAVARYALREPQLVTDLREC